jgi:hypothetical protein
MSLVEGHDQTPAGIRNFIPKGSTVVMGSYALHLV